MLLLKLRGRVGALLRELGVAVRELSSQPLARKTALLGNLRIVPSTLIGKQFVAVHPLSRHPLIRPPLRDQHRAHHDPSDSNRARRGHKAHEQKPRAPGRGMPARPTARATTGAGTVTIVRETMSRLPGPL